jgi:hypothetical protein
VQCSKIRQFQLMNHNHLLLLLYSTDYEMNKALLSKNHSSYTEIPRMWIRRVLWSWNVNDEEYWAQITSNSVSSQFLEWKKKTTKYTVQKRKGRELTSHNLQQEKERTNTHGIEHRVIKVKGYVSTFKKSILLIACSQSP